MATSRMHLCSMRRYAVGPGGTTRTELVEIELYLVVREQSRS
jgi:hypothetical protein